MARTAALGDGPIVFVTSDGAQIEVPLSAIYFENDQVGTTRPNDPSSASLAKWLEFLASRRRLVPDVAPPTAPAAVVTAAAPGSPGDRIQVIVTPKSATTVDVTVTETDVYEGLSRPTIDGVLGKGTGAATRPGLLKVNANPNPNTGAAPQAADDITATPPNPPTTTVPTWTIAGAGGTALILEPRNTAVDPVADDFTVSVSDVSTATPRTFTLTVLWSKTVTDVAVADLPAKLAPLGYLVDVSAPSSGYKLPRSGTVNLSGGKEPAAAVAATSTILAND